MVAKVCLSSYWKRGSVTTHIQIHDKESAHTCYHLQCVLYPKHISGVQVDLPDSFVKTLSAITDSLPLTSFPVLLYCVSFQWG